tara:strand:+ start:615 stop:1259 length:645 start_codon:yes stop_codon:yes gene_type:complete
MDIFVQLDYYLAARVNSYLNTRKLVYSKFIDKESWAMINAVPHSYCIKKADKKSWDYISGRKRFGTRRTWYSYTENSFDMYYKRNNSLKWHTRIEKNYNDFVRISNRNRISDEPFYSFRDMIQELENSSVKDKYNQIRKEKYNNLLESIEYELDICVELQDLISKKLENIQDVIKYKLRIIYKMCGYDREKLWRLLKVLESIDYDNVFQLLDKI